jgi:hypothetical protein
VKCSFLDAYEVQQAGARTHLEYWIPADDLDAFNDAIVGEIRVTARIPLMSEFGETLPWPWEGGMAYFGCKAASGRARPLSWLRTAVFGKPGRSDDPPIPAKIDLKPTQVFVRG